MSDGKYVVFKLSDWLDQREAINRVSNRKHLATAHTEPLDDALRALDRARLDDAVVIRRQDIFAGPALHTYAAVIDIGAKLSGQEHVREDLRKISDYFHEQAVLADEEGVRVPD